MYEIIATQGKHTNQSYDSYKGCWWQPHLDNDRPRIIYEVISKIINNDVCWVSIVGQSCEKNHDLIDDEIQFREVNIENLYLPKHDIMTTWHNNFDNGFWFSIFAANDEDVEIDKVVILDMTDGTEAEGINKLIEGFQVSG